MKESKLTPESSSAGLRMDTEVLRIVKPNLERQEKWDRRFLELAKQVSTWSKDPSTQVGAVLVNDLLQVVGMGYNGFPRGVEDWQMNVYADRELKVPDGSSC
jgi:deoxycytidylate deaminase